MPVRLSSGKYISELGSGSTPARLSRAVLALLKALSEEVNPGSAVKKFY